MPKKDHHEKAYDDGTILKLEIFERYVEAWLPTFIMQKNVSEINIVDFFAGPGYDIEGKEGSPIRILKKIDSFFGFLQKNNTKINFYLNEFDNQKFESLQGNCNEYLEKNKRIKKFVNFEYSNKDFDVIFEEIIEKTKYKSSLYIIDQCGVKFTNQENFSKLEKLNQTDFLFFISSSFFKRFNTQDAAKKHLEINAEALKKNPYNFIHRSVLETYRSLIPEKSRLKIYPFSIKKGANIYGIIFGSKHPVGVEKFLRIAWDKNKINGEADYDIDEDAKKSQMEMDFIKGRTIKKLTKVEKFEIKLRRYIKLKEVVTNKVLYHETINQGHIPLHTRECLKRLKQQKKIEFSGHSCISWNAIKDGKKVEFKWIK